jgi:hypothetical protein
MTERLWVQTPTEETIFQAPFIWIKVWIKNQEEICCYLAKGRVEFEDGWLIKSSFIITFCRGKNMPLLYQKAALCKNQIISILFNSREVLRKIFFSQLTLFPLNPSSNFQSKKTKLTGHKQQIHTQRK